MKPSNAFNHLALAIFVLAVFAPLVALVGEAGKFLSAGHGPWLELVVPTGRRLGLLLRSLGLATGVAAGSVIVGAVAAIRLWRWNKGTVARLHWLVLLLVVIPPYIHALAWSAAIDGFNVFLQSHGIHVLSFQGWSACWWVQLMALAPLATGLSLMGLEGVEPELIAAARLMKPDSQVLARVVLPLAAPPMLAAAGFVFLLSITDYSVPSLYQLNVYSLEIFAEYSATGDPARTFLLAVPLLLVTVLVLFISQAALRNAVLRPLVRSGSAMSDFTFPRWLEWAQRLWVALMFAQAGVPVVMLLATAGSWQAMRGSVMSSSDELLFTLVVSLAAAAASLPVGLAVAGRLLREDGWGRLWWFLVTAPLAVSPPLVGIGLVSIWNRPLFSPMYGSVLMPVLASLARFAPLAALVLLARLRSSDPLLLDAARVFQTSTVKTWLRIRIPLVLPGLLAAGSVVFVLAAGELGATLIVAPPGRSTLTMKIYNYLHYGASETVAGLCLAMAAAALLAGLFCVVAVDGGWRFLGRRFR